MYRPPLFCHSDTSITTEFPRLSVPQLTTTVRIRPSIVLTLAFWLTSLNPLLAIAQSLAIGLQAWIVQIVLFP